MCRLGLPSIEPAVHQGHQAVGCGDARGDREDRQRCELDAVEERTRRDVAQHYPGKEPEKEVYEKGALDLGQGEVKKGAEAPRGQTAAI